MAHRSRSAGCRQRAGQAGRSRSRHRRRSCPCSGCRRPRSRRRRGGRAGPAQPRVAGVRGRCWVKVERSRPAPPGGNALQRQPRHSSQSQRSRPALSPPARSRIARERPRRGAWAALRATRVVSLGRGVGLLAPGRTARSRRLFPVGVGVWCGCFGRCGEARARGRAGRAGAAHGRARLVVGWRRT